MDEQLYIPGYYKEISINGKRYLEKQQIAKIINNNNETVGTIRSDGDVMAILFKNGLALLWNKFTNETKVVNLIY